MGIDLHYDPKKAVSAAKGKTTKGKMTKGKLKAREALRDSGESEVDPEEKSDSGPSGPPTRGHPVRPVKETARRGPLRSHLLAQMRAETSKCSYTHVDACTDKATPVREVYHGVLPQPQDDKKGSESGEDDEEGANGMSDCGFRHLFLL